MMQIRCQRCGWNFTLGRETIGLAVAEAQANHLEYYQFVCPKCRHEVKVQVDVLQRHLPLDYVLPTPPQKPEPVTVIKEESNPVVVKQAKPKTAVVTAAEPVKPARSAPIGQAKAAKPATVKKAAAKKSTSKKPTVTKVAAKKTTTVSAKKSAVKKSKK
jgi:hypothetical protein